MTTPKPNAELAYKTLDHITANPSQWDQGIWWCGTGGCFAGWAVTLAGITIPFDEDSPEEETVEVDGKRMPVADAALEVLGVGRYDLGAETAEGGVASLFEGSNTLADLTVMVPQIFGPRPRTCCSSTEDVGHDFTCRAMLADAGVALDYDDVPPNAGSAS